MDTPRTPPGRLARNAAISRANLRVSEQALKNYEMKKEMSGPVVMFLAIAAGIVLWSFSQMADGEFALISTRDVYSQLARFFERIRGHKSRKEMRRDVMRPQKSKRILPQGDTSSLAPRKIEKQIPKPLPKSSSEPSLKPPVQKEFTIAASQQWVFDAVTQRVPAGASSMRLASLPAPHDKILLQHLGAFGAHKGGHPEGLDHEWIDIQDGTPVGSWADGTVIEVKLNNPSEPHGEWRVIIDYGDGLFGEHMDVKTPLVKKGALVKAGEPVAVGVAVPWISGFQSGEFNLTDEHRRDGVKSWVRPTGVFVSPFDYLRDEVKQDFISVFTREVLEAHVSKADMAAGVKPWEPYLTNPMLFHKMYQGTLAGEWLLKSRKWAEDGVPDVVIFFADNTKYYDQQRVLASEDEGKEIFIGTWEAEYVKKQFILRTESEGLYYGLFELNESGPRATLTIEYQRESYPAAFSDRAHVYIERDALPRRQDGYNIGARENFY